MQLLELIRLIKANNAAGLSINNTLLPAQAEALIDLVVAQSEFLQSVWTIKSKKLKTPVPVMNLSERNLTRVPEGTKASDSNAVFAQSSNEGKELNLTNVDLFYDLLYSVITNNQDDKTLVSMIELQIATMFANDLLDLATNGTSDTYNKVYHATTNPIPMYTLAKGWVTLLKESSLSNKVNTASDADLLVSLKKAIQTMPNAYKNKQCKLIISPAQAETFNVLMGAKDSSAGIYLAGNAKTYLGYELKENPFLPDDIIIFANPQDLIWGVSIQDVQKAMENQVRSKCIEYTYTLPTDFEIARDRAMVIAYPFSA